jgi:hypothetical protein
VNDRERIQTNDSDVALAELTSSHPETGDSRESFTLGWDRPLPKKSLHSSGGQRAALGEPLAIEDVAVLLGCSAWTVRQRYVRQGLPYLQARPRGKLVFFREQVIAWIEKRQQQRGGILR